MNSKKFLCFSFFLIYFFLSAAPVFAFKALKVRSEGNTLLEKNSSQEKIKIKVFIKQGKVNKLWKYSNVSMWGGDDGVLPKYSLSCVKVNINNKSIRLPLSSYVDLGDVYDASIDIFHGGFDIKINGGDTSSSYIAILRFRGNNLISRSVILKEFPEQNWEITNYSYTEVTN